MAAIANRAQVFITAFVLFCAALFLTALSNRHPEVGQVGSLFVSEIVRPFEVLSTGAHTSIQKVWDGYFNLVNVKEENEHLRENLRRLESENSRLLELQSENENLTRLLKMKQSAKLGGVVARVVGYDASNWVQAITIDKGAQDNISVGMAVLEGNGVVGQTIAVGSKSSRILLITDHSSGVDAILQGNRVRGVVGGVGNNAAELRYVLNEATVTVGDRVITSGFDGIYPKGLLIGIVSNFRKRKVGLFQEIDLKPSVDLTRLENVFVVTSLEKISE